MGSKPLDISASRGAGLLGLSKWNSPLEGWIRIMESREPGFCDENGYPPPEPVDNASVRWGTAFEDAIIDLAEDKQRGDIEQREFAFMHPEFEFITCHVDGIYTDRDPYVIHEGKTTTDFTFRDSWGEPGSNKVPREIQIQVQHQMIATGLQEAIVSVLVWPRRPDDWEAIGRFPDIKSMKASDLKEKWIIDPLEWAGLLDEMGYFHQFHLEADRALQEMMIEAYVRIWEVNIIGREPPKPVNYRDIRMLCPEPKGTIVANEQIERMSAEYKQINEELAAASKRKDELKTLLCGYMRDAAEVSIDDDSTEKWILRDRQGRKLNQYNGKTFR